MAECYGCKRITVILYGFLGLLTLGICTKQEVLLDTTKSNGQQRLNWTKKVIEPDPPDPTNAGWNEVTGKWQNGSLVRVHTSCYVSSHDVNNWLRTPFIDVKDAKSLYIQMTFTMRKCVKHNNPSSLQQCRETFNLYYYEADRDFANQEMPAWDEMSYTMVDKIAADHLFESTDEFILNHEVRFVSLQKGLRGIYFAFQDTGSCVTLMAVQIYYKMCESTTHNYAFFTQTPTGVGERDYVPVEGTCVPNSEFVNLKETPSYSCMSDGTWDIERGGCWCKPGFEGNDDENICSPCQQNYYKWEPGNEKCLSCPRHSYADMPGRRECDCLDNYWRAPDDDKSMPCTEPPTPPQVLQVIEVTDKIARLTWSAPSNKGGRNDITYRIEVECPKCRPSDISDIMVRPKYSGFNTTSAELSNLTPNTKYRIYVYAENGVSAVSKKQRFADTEITTQASIPQVTKLNAIDVGETYISLSWELHDDSTSQVVVLQYEILRYIKGQIGTEAVNFTTSTSITFKELKLKTEYVFQVKGQTSKGWGEYSEPIFVTTGTPYDSKDELAPSPSVGIIVGAIVAVVLCMGIATVMIIILFKRNRRHDGKNPDIDGPYQHVTVPLFQPTGSVKSYVDPHTYEDPNQAVREFTREIDASHITIESVIGGGEFGDVCRGKLRIPGRPEMSVAIKTLKPGATDKNRLDFLTEASIMGQFDDPNVIFLEGVMTKSHPIMIVTEYMANGSLDTFLRKNDGQLTVIQLVGMMRGIASGMRYLSEMGYVHRDLAARNILVNEILVCKVADFGLSREVDIDTTDGAYTTKGGKIPVRWTAPEAIAFRKFTSASDVWSYGVVMWEVISYGERPYWNWSNQDVIKAVEKSYRLPPPMECPEAIYHLMLDAWQKERNSRPKFLQIVKTLDKLIRAPELLRKMAKPRPQVFIDTQADITNFGSVEEWLNVIKMERYIDTFVSAGFSSMDQILRLTIKDLDTLGITLLGHQKKIMNSVQTLRAQLLGPQIHLPTMQMSEGFLV